MRPIVLIAFLFISTNVVASDKGGLPKCKAELNDEFNQLISKSEWKENLYLGSLTGASQAVLISTSLGNDQIMSLWVREKQEKKQVGMFSFVDLSSGKDQYLRFYMADGYSVGVTCKWEADF